MILTPVSSLTRLPSAASARSVSTAAAGAGFDGMIADAAGKVVADLRLAENQSLAGIEGRTDLRAVVDSILTAQQSLQAAVAIRDRLVTAWLDISRMQI